MGEFKFKDTVENLKTNLLDNLGRWVPTAIAANGIINGIIAYILFITRGGYTKQIQLVRNMVFLEHMMKSSQQERRK